MDTFGWQHGPLLKASEDVPLFKAATHKLNRPNMKKQIFKKTLLLAFVALGSVFTTSAQTENGGLSQSEITRIIGRFTAKEAEFRRAISTYSFKRDALIQKIGMGGQVIGEYHKVSTFTFDDQGNRFEKISFFPMATIPEVTNEDIEDLGGISPFALEPSRVDRYNFRYVGKEKIDDLNLYIFDVSPKVMPDPKKIKDRLFSGRVWVDDQDLQIVKTKGKGVPETKSNKFPIVDTYREHIDGRYWFPTYSYADEELIFDNGSSLHIRMKVRYTDFAPTRATLKVTEIGEDENSTGSNTLVDLGELDSKALTKPKPVLSEEAKRLKATGKVNVKVIVDENGKVVSATALNNIAVLREAAETAAKQATFKPLVQDGITVRFTGVLTYDIR